MKKKRLLSALLASALIISAMPFQAFATDTSSNGSINGSSNVVSNAEKKVVIPANVDFSINPLGLPVTDGGTVTNDQIISAPFSFINKSNMDLQVSVTPKFSDPDGVTIASSPDEIKNTPNEAPTIFLQLAPATAKAPMTGIGDNLEFASSPALTFASGAGISTNVVASGEAVNVARFKLHNVKTAYEVSGGAMAYVPTKVDKDSADAIAFKFIGKVSQMSAWTGKSPKVEFSYKLDLISADSYADTNNNVAGAYGLVNKDLAASGPVFNLNTSGHMAITDLPAGYRTTNLYYVFSSTPISVTTSDIESAISGGTVVGATVKGLTVSEMIYEDQYSWNGDTYSGDFTSQALSNLNGYNLVAFTIAIKEGSPDIVIVSPNVKFGA